MPANRRYSDEQLLTLIGQQIVYHQQQCEIIELLDGCEFVVQVLESNTSIQATQYGEGHRAVPMTYVLPICDGEGSPHSDMIVAGIDKLLEQS